MWERIYAKNSIPKIITGKAYTKCIRAWFLTDAALHLRLMKSFFSKESALDDKCSDDTDERDFDFNVGDCNKILPVELIKMLEDQYSQMMSNGSYLGDDEFKNSF